MSEYLTYVEQLKEALGGLAVTSRDGSLLTQNEGLRRWLEMTHALRLDKKTMYFIGNGASAMMAGHMAADASKNGGFRSLAFNDAALMTAVSNDICYAQCFSFPLMRFADPGDILTAISSSGNSPNVVAAIEQARAMNLGVITLTGLKPDNKARTMGDLNFYIPASTYGLVEASHQALLHGWLDLYMEAHPETQS
ncbi:MAG: SIS domain-containing protein [Solidesulfovibrio sp.]|uniref:SIS domain-containing protein n=1 Tax=Solidesulfovibrio sp. TaxID=2910990 RepID=UPI0031591159